MIASTPIAAKQTEQATSLDTQAGCRRGLAVRAATDIAAGSVLVGWTLMALLATGWGSGAAIVAPTSVFSSHAWVSAPSQVGSERRYRPAADDESHYVGVFPALGQASPVQLRVGFPADVTRVAPDRERHWWGSGADPPSV